MKNGFRTRRMGAGRLRRALLALTILSTLPLARFDECLAATPPSVDDTVVAGAIRRALASEYGPSASTIWVEVYRGAVYLSGGLPTTAERTRVETVAAAVRGVVSVQSEFDARPAETRLAGR